MVAGARKTDELYSRLGVEDALARSACSPIVSGDRGSINRDCAIAKSIVLI